MWLLELTEFIADCCLGARRVPGEFETVSKRPESDTPVDPAGLETGFQKVDRLEPWDGEGDDDEEHRSDESDEEPWGGGPY